MSKEMDQVKADHEKLKDELERARSKRDVVRSFVKTSECQKIIKDFEHDIELDKESLIASDAKGLPLLQAGIKAKRALIREFNYAYEDEVRNAQEALNKHTTENALLLQSNSDTAVKERKQA